MSTLHHRLRSATLAVSICLMIFTTQTVAQTPYAEARSSVHGIVRDPLGAAIPNATVDLLDANSAITTTTHTDADGAFRLPIATAARYALRASAVTFATTITPARFLSATGDTTFDVTLSTPTLTEEVTVTATGTPTPLAQVAASITVLTADQFPHAHDIQEPLRYVPGLQLTQTGQAGGTGGLSIRGGATNTSKVLIDGVPANDIGGASEFANIATTGIARIEVLREPNSALYGSDALAGVVSLTTKRGITAFPQLVYSAEGGNFSSYRQEAALSGVLQKLDYFADFGRQDTHNSIPGNSFHNATFAGNFGYQPDPKTDLRLTYRHLA